MAGRTKAPKGAHHVGDKLESWPDRWERLTGTRPNVVAISGKGIRSQHFEFVDDQGIARPITWWADRIKRPLGTPGVNRCKRKQAEKIKRLQKCRDMSLLGLHRLRLTAFKDEKGEVSRGTITEED